MLNITDGTRYIYLTRSESILLELRLSEEPFTNMDIHNHLFQFGIGEKVSNTLTVTPEEYNRITSLFFQKS